MLLERTTMAHVHRTWALLLLVFQDRKKRTQLDVEMIIMLVGALLLNSDAPV